MTSSIWLRSERSDSPWLRLASFLPTPILGLVWRDHDSNSADSHFRNAGHVYFITAVHVASFNCMHKAYSLATFNWTIDLTGNVFNPYWQGDLLSGIYASVVADELWLESNGRIVNALGSAYAYASQCSSLSFPWLPSTGSSPSLGDYRLIVLHFFSIGMLLQLSLTSGYTLSDLEPSWCT